MHDDTIFALATAAIPAGIAVIRISGPAAGPAAIALTGGRALPNPRQAVPRPIVDPAGTSDPGATGGEILDRGLLLWFPAPASLTGEDVAELHVHGGRAVVAGVLAALSGQPGLRPAEAGEFTRRAFEQGKLDLTQAEAIADLVAAETAAQRQQAVRQMGGALGALYEGWRARLVGILAHLEAWIDFPDEDLPAAVEVDLRAGIAALAADVRAHLADEGRGERLREGLHVAIVGAPNAGKSSLLNRLARRDAAIVSATAGTTRDVIEVHLDLGGFPVVVADTAGLREATEEVEAEGVRRALERATAADLKLVVIDATTGEGPETAAFQGLIDDRTVIVMNKMDLVPAGTASVVGAWSNGGGTGDGRIVGLSARTGAGLAALEGRLLAEVQQRWGAMSAAPALTRVRHRRGLEDCVAGLERGLAAPLVDLMAEDVRLAARALGRVTGRIEVDEVLDVIFRDFCIGK